MWLELLSVVDVRFLFVLRAFEQEVHAIGMRDHDDLRVGRHVQMVADIAQALGRLRLGVVDVEITLSCAKRRWMRGMGFSGEWGCDTLPQWERRFVRERV